MSVIWRENCIIMYVHISRKLKPLKKWLKASVNIAETKSYITYLRILTGKKARQIKLRRSQKVVIWAFGSLVHQINSLQKAHNLKQDFQKNKVVTGKTPFYVIGPFCNHHSICLNIGFWYGSFVSKWCVSSLSAFNEKKGIQFF